MSIFDCPDAHCFFNSSCRIARSKITSEPDLEQSLLPRQSRLPHRSGGASTQCRNARAKTNYMRKRHWFETYSEIQMTDAKPFQGNTSAWRKIFENVMRSITAPLLAVYHRLVKRQAPLVVKIKMLAMQIADIRLRNRFDLPFRGDNEQIDGQIDRSLDKFFDWSTYAHEHVDSRSEYDTWLIQDQPSIENRSILFRTAHWLYHNTDQKVADLISKAHEILYQEAIEPSDLFHPLVYDSHRKLRRAWRSEYRARRKAKQKALNFSVQENYKILPWISVVFLLGGYVHLSILYAEFGIDVVDYFLIGDYISSSVDQIQSALVGVIGFFLGMVRRHLTEQTISKDQSNRRARIDNHIWLVVFAISILYICICWNRSFFPNVTFQTSLLATWLSVIFVGLVSIGYLCRRYFREPAAISVFAMAVMFFFTNLIMVTYGEINAIKAKDAPVPFTLRAGDVQFTEQQSRIIGSNSRFLFLYKTDGRTEIIPVSRIDAISLGKS